MLNSCHNFINDVATFFVLCIKKIINSLPTIPSFLTVKQRTFENSVGKGENAGNQHFLHFQQCFLPFPNQISIFHSRLFCRLQMLSILTELRFCRLVKSQAPFSYSRAHYTYWEIAQAKINS